MTHQTQLLCTFVSMDDMDASISRIQSSYEFVFNKIYVLNNADDETQVILTYNIVTGSEKTNSVPPSTISVHRKKLTNTIYTINALNKLIELMNNGILDKSYKIEWGDLKNVVLVTAYGKLKKVNTELSHIITW